MSAAVFDLKRPCTSCPFRKSQGHLFALSARRLAEIRAATAFQCHKTVDYDSFEDDRPQQCAGLMAVLAREGADNQIMQVAQRWGVLKTAELDPQREAYDTWADVLTAHKSLTPPRQRS